MLWVVALLLAVRSAARLAGTCCSTQVGQLSKRFRHGSSRAIMAYTGFSNPTSVSLGAPPGPHGDPLIRHARAGRRHRPEITPMMSIVCLSLHSGFLD